MYSAEFIQNNFCCNNYEQKTQMCSGIINYSWHSFVKCYLQEVYLPEDSPFRSMLTCDLP